MANYVYSFMQIVCVILLVFCIFFCPGGNIQEDDISRTLKSENCTIGEIQEYPSLDKDNVLTEVSTNTSSTNSTPTVFLDNFVQKSGNATEEDDVCTLLSRIAAIFRRTPCFRKTPNSHATNGSQENERSSNVTLKVKKYHSPNFTLCKPVTKDAFVVSVEKTILGYPTTLTVAIIAFIYTSISLLCALVCIISVPKFIMMFIISNFYSYFLLCILLRGSLSWTLIYLIPFHLNFLFFLVTGWVTLLSCKVVFKRLTDSKIFFIVNGEVVGGNASKMFHLNMLLSFLFFVITLLGTPPYGMLCISLVVENVYPKLMVHLTPSVILLLLTVMGFDVVFTSLRKRTRDFGVRHTKCYIMFICYHLLAMVTWMYGLLAVNLAAYPFFWQVYLFVSTCLPFSFMQNVFLSSRANILLHKARDANIENIFRVRIENV